MGQNIDLLFAREWNPEPFNRYDVASLLEMIPSPRNRGMGHFGCRGVKRGELMRLAAAAGLRRVLP
jgi:hypothetical protein